MLVPERIGTAVGQTREMRWVAPVLLAVAFAFAAGAKFADRAGTTKGFEALGLRRPEQLAIQVPTIELSTAVLLIVAPVGGALVALLLLGAFTLYLVRKIRAGSDAPCKCFGGVGTHPVGWRDVARNAVLGALAVVVVAAPPG
jgi:hypothetical protein